MAVKLTAAKRDDLTSSKIKELRDSGQVPAIVYGKDKETKSVAVESIALLKTVRDEGRNAIITLDIEGDSSVDVMLQDYQMDPIKDSLVHVDFYIVDMSEEREVSIPVHIEGDAVGVRDGGIVQQPLYEVLITVKPADIPDQITVNVTELAIGDVISIADLPKSDKYEFVDEADTVIVSVVPPAAEEPETSVDETAEPELVGKKDEADAQ
ncbi:50S ribosomal protein L25/general stress protein Ctc [Oceanobacillus sp. FSL H7-0719]|uniref:50S ribosomal protein L25/general stress protein Ctc n=1 Tax=Oceanobacillus sp. FSL H7-0719 TaxID=2954507 RepID=UPI00324BB3C6